jgi:hypothetical protein
MNSNPYDVSTPSEIATAEAPGRMASYLCSHIRRTVIAITVWQLVCLAMAYVYQYFVSHLVTAAYTSICGDVQASYDTFARLATYLGLLIVTLMASLVTLSIVDRLSGCRARARRKIRTLVSWQVAVMLILVLSYEVDFPSMLHRIGWQLLGPPTEIYSFRNLILHRIIAWLLCTTPIAWLAVRTYCHSCETQFAQELPAA